MQRRPPSSLRPSTSEALRCGHMWSITPTRPEESRKATSFSPSSSRRRGVPSFSSSPERAAGIQYCRMKLPIVVPGPTRVRSWLSWGVIVAPSKLVLCRALAQHADRLDLPLRAETGVAFDAIQVHHHGGSQHREVMGALGGGRSFEDALPLGRQIGDVGAPLELVGGLGALVAIHQRDARVGADGADEGALGIADPQCQPVIAEDLHRATETEYRLP